MTGSFPCSSFCNKRAVASRKRAIHSRPPGASRYDPPAKRGRCCARRRSCSFCFNIDDSSAPTLPWSSGRGGGGRRVSFSEWLLTGMVRLFHSLSSARISKNMHVLIFNPISHLLSRWRRGRACKRKPFRPYPIRVLTLDCRDARCSPPRLCGVN